MESEEHEMLKQVAKEILKSKGFAEDQIFTEYPIIQSGQILPRMFNFTGPMTEIEEHPVIVKRGIIADVVGIDDTHSAVIECGVTPTERLSQLKLFFDEVYFLPYVKTTNHEKETLELNSQIVMLTKENAKLKQDYDECRGRLANLEGKLIDALRSH